MRQDALGAIVGATMGLLYRKENMTNKVRTNQNKPRNNSAPVAVSPVEQSSKAQRSADRSTIEAAARRGESEAGLAFVHSLQLGTQHTRGRVVVAP